MIIKSIHLKEGLFERKIVFSSYVSLVHSSKNSCGKTTLLRFILYGMGYNIPNTRKINFNNCEVNLFLECEKYGNIELCRTNNISIILIKNGMNYTYVLPEQQHELHEQLFGTNNVNILNNLLGAFYVDQEKGWTLLNRGVVIGSIRFNIEELIRGLSDRDCSELIKKESCLLRERQKYNQMFSVAQYRESIEEDAGSVAVDSYEEETNAELSQLLLRQRQLKSELKRIDQTLSENTKFKQFVADMKLLVQAPDGTTFAVTHDNIVGFNDSLDLLIAKRKIVSGEYALVSSKISALEKEQENEYEQLTFFQTASQIEVFDRKILRMPLNPQAIKKQQLRLEKELKAIRDEISRVTKSDNQIVKSISEKIIQYGTELGIGNEDTIPQTYLFTSNLKELSGALLHKTAFAFRLAYIGEIEKKLDIKLPIILDSPSGKEVDQENISLMINILKRDFANHQIIIASIFEYNFDDYKKIEIEDRLIDKMMEVQYEQ